MIKKLVAVLGLALSIAPVAAIGGSGKYRRWLKSDCDSRSAAETDSFKFCSSLGELLASRLSTFRGGSVEFCDIPPHFMPMFAHSYGSQKKAGKPLLVVENGLATVGDLRKELSSMGDDVLVQDALKALDDERMDTEDADRLIPLALARLIMVNTLRPADNASDFPDVAVDIEIPNKPCPSCTYRILLMHADEARDFELRENWLLAGKLLENNVHLVVLSPTAADAESFKDEMRNPFLGSSRMLVTTAEGKIERQLKEEIMDWFVNAWRPLSEDQLDALRKVFAPMYEIEKNKDRELWQDIADLRQEVAADLAYGDSNAVSSQEVMGDRA